MVRDSYCGIRTCDLPVSVLIQGTTRSAVGWGTSEFPSQLIALLLVAQWLERWCDNLVVVSLKSVANHHHSIMIYMLMRLQFCLQIP